MKSLVVTLTNGEELVFAGERQCAKCGSADSANGGPCAKCGHHTNKRWEASGSWETQREFFERVVVTAWSDPKYEITANDYWHEWNYGVGTMMHEPSYIEKVLAYYWSDYTINGEKYGFETESVKPTFYEDRKRTKVNKEKKQGIYKEHAPEVVMNGNWMKVVVGSTEVANIRTDMVALTRLV